MWWFSMPAMLKGWVDRVFAFGSVYDFGQTWEEGRFYRPSRDAFCHHQRTGRSLSPPTGATAI